MAVRIYNPGVTYKGIKPINKVIDINPALDTRLSGLARSIVYYALARQKLKVDWKVQLFDLYNQFPQDSKYSIRHSVKELSSLGYLTLRRFPKKGKEFQGTYYEIYDHKPHRNKRPYIPPTIERITDRDIIDRLCSLPWKNEAGETVYLNELQLQN